MTCDNFLTGTEQFKLPLMLLTGLPHTKGIFKLRKSQGNSGNFDSFFNSGKFKDFLKTSAKVFLDLEWDLVNPVSIFCSKKLILLIFKGIGGLDFFFSTKNNKGPYMKAWSTNYEPVFIELKIIF